MLGAKERIVKRIQAAFVDSALIFLGIVLTFALSFSFLSSSLVGEVKSSTRPTHRER